MLLKEFSIRINVIERGTQEVKFKIMNQPNEWRVNSGHSLTIYEPQNKKEVYIKSTSFPEFSPHTDTLYIKGEDRNLDNNTVSCTLYDFKRILNSLEKLENKKNNKIMY